MFLAKIRQTRERRQETALPLHSATTTQLLEWIPGHPHIMCYRRQVQGQGQTGGASELQTDTAHNSSSDSNGSIKIS